MLDSSMPGLLLSTSHFIGYHDLVTDLMNDIILMYNIKYYYYCVHFAIIIIIFIDKCAISFNLSFKSLFEFLYVMPRTHSVMHVSRI